MIVERMVRKHQGNPLCAIGDYFSVLQTPDACRHVTPVAGRLQEVCESIRASQRRYTFHVLSAGNRAPSCAGGSKGVDRKDCSSCSVENALSCDGDSYGCQLVCRVQRGLFFPLRCYVQKGEVSARL